MPRPTWLEEHGISFGLVSKADVLSKVRGGVSDSVATRYRGHVDLTTEIDTKRIGLWSGGTIFLAAQNGHGQGISEGDVGDVQALSNIDAHSFTQMSEWFLEQAWLEERLRVKVGRQDAGADFACVEFGGEFLNSSFGLIPTAPVPTFPDRALGVSAFADVTDELSVGAGVYAPTPTTWGRIRGTTFGIEVGYSPGSSRPKTTRYRAGYWYQRDPFEAQAPGVHSLYAALDRTLFFEGEGDQGLRAFLQAGTTSGAPNGVSDYLGVGFIYQGFLPGRDEDSFGLGVAHARLPEASGRGLAETDIELLYRVTPWPWLTLQPSLHYVLRPGGQGENALVVGLRLETQF
jgi:porin